MSLKIVHYCQVVSYLIKFDCIGEILVNSKHFSTTVTKVMITSGWPKSSATKTEIVDVVSGENCADLADFPWEIEGAVGANLHGTPAVCGGWSSNYIRKCYKFTNGGWKVFASMKEKRRDAAGVHCKYIRCKNYSFSTCPISRCNSTVLFTFNYCS